MQIQLLEHPHRLIVCLLWSRNTGTLCYGTSHQPLFCANGRILELGGEENVIADDIPKTRGKGGGGCGLFIYLYSVFNIIIILSGMWGGGGVKGKERKYQVVSRKGREGKERGVQ